jgi:hypothetical protein
MKTVCFLIFLLFSFLSTSAQTTYKRTEYDGSFREVYTIKKYPKYQLIEKNESFDIKNGQLEYLHKYYYEGRTLKRCDLFNGKGELINRFLYEKDRFSTTVNTFNSNGDLTSYKKDIYNKELDYTDKKLIQSMHYSKNKNGEESLDKWTYEYNQKGLEIRNCIYELNPTTQESKNNYPSECFNKEYEKYGRQIKLEYSYSYYKTEDGKINKDINDSTVYSYNNEGFITNEIRYYNNKVKKHLTYQWAQIVKTGEFYTNKKEIINYDWEGNIESKNVFVFDEEGLLEKNDYKFIANEFIRENYWHR